MTEHEPDQPIVAQGAETIVEVQAQAEAAGYTTQFIAREGGYIECRSCERPVNPASFGVDGARRLEGASDVADEVLVVWSTCPSCGARGVLTLGYGPNATEADLAVLPHLHLPS